MRRADIVVVGQVQGVFFRISTKNKARALNLKGWVRNEGHDAVHIVAEGTEEKLKELIRFARIGPPSADVRDIDITYSEAKHEFKDFRIFY